ncbi:zinc finger protein 560-like [Sphaerodactylus townsendi]|uniref:zinc finger protein 560-like n=1 Tax=Sphaerodactylus townsendi TaxID=933632 RepID=UPI002027010F|nr:zinc finger protein 560-like [Sphaerodactylus townsendi]
MESLRVPFLSGSPRLEEESGFCLSAGERSPLSFEEVAVFFMEGEWALLDPSQRKLFWEVMEENYETVASLGNYISQKALLTQEKSTLPFLGVHGMVFPQGREGNLWNVEFHRTSPISHFPWLEGEFGSCTSAGKVSSVFHQQHEQERGEES